MGAGYELRPVTIGRSAGQGPLAIVAAIGLIGVLLVLKPWVFLGGSGAGDPGDAQAPQPAAVAAPADQPGPAQSGAPSSDPSALGSLAQHSGVWGVGASGLGPHNEAEPWAGWTAVTPEAIASSTGVPNAPSRGQCDGVPTLPSDPLFIAISHETDVPVDRRVVAWWFDVGTPTPLVDEIHQVTTGDRGIAYVIRNDRSPWPAGRYEFDLVAGDQAAGLTVCLNGRP